MHAHTRTHTRVHTGARTHALSLPPSQGQVALSATGWGWPHTRPFVCLVQAAVLQSGVLWRLPCDQEVEPGREGRMWGSPAGPGVREAPWPVEAAERRVSVRGRCLFLPQAQPRELCQLRAPGPRRDVRELRPKADTRGPCAAAGRVPATSHRARAGVPEPWCAALGPGARPSSPATPRLLPGPEAPEKLWG